MEGKIYSGQLCTVVPVDREIKEGDIVLCRVQGSQYLHLIKSVRHGNRYQIGNNRGGINGWVGLDSIYGICVKVET